MDIPQEIIDYRKAMPKIKSLSEKRKAEDKKYYDMKWELKNKYRDMVWELKKQERTELKVIESEESATLQKIDEELQQLYKPGNKVREIIASLKKGDATLINVPIVGWRKYGEFHKAHLQEPLQRSPELNVDIAIIENDKPKNKYEVIVIGYSKFEKYRDYGVNESTEEYTIFSVVKCLYETYSLKTATEWYTKNLKDKANLKLKSINDLYDFILKMKGYQEQYAQYKEKYSLEDFVPYVPEDYFDITW